MKKEGKVWVIDRKSFLAAMIETSQDITEGNIRLLRRISALEPLPHHVLAKISDLIQIVRKVLP